VVRNSEIIQPHVNTVKRVGVAVSLLHKLPSSDFRTANDMPTTELVLFVEMMQVGPVQFGGQLFVSKCQFCSLTGEYEISEETNNTIWLIQ
jgi:hypothetical protein